MTNRQLAILRGDLSVRVQIGAVVLFVLAPALLLAGWFALRFASSERAQLEQTLYQKTSEIIADIDREIINTRSLLTALASSHFLQTENIEAFYRQVSELTWQRRYPIVLRDARSDQHVFNTYAPLGNRPGRPVPPERRKAEEEALRTGQPVISGIFFGNVSRQHVVSVVVPVAVDGRPRFTLSVGIPALEFARLLQDANLGPDRVAVVLDRNNVFVARSDKHDQFVGTAAATPPPSGSQGFFALKNRDGTPFHWSYRRSEITGWVIGVGIPDSVLGAPSRMALLAFAAVGIFLFGGAIGLSYFIGGRLSQLLGKLGIDREPTRDEFRLLFESSPNGVLVADHEGHIALVNARMQEMFGYNREELIGAPVEILLPERLRADHAAVKKAFMHAPEARAMGAGRDLVGRRKDGSEFPIEIGLTPIRTRSSSLVMATVVDMSERKSAAERLVAAAAALRASEEQRRFAIAAAEIGTWSWDIASDEVLWSDKLREILGVPLTMPASHDNYFARIHPADRNIVEGNKQRCLSGQDRYELEYRIVRLLDGSIRWVQSKGSVTRDASGKPLRLQGAIIDVTARKQAERDRDDLRRRFMHAQEQERLRLAHELHDQTGQLLAAIMLEVKGIEAHVTETARDRLRRLRQQLEHMGQTLHHVAWELRPSAINELGLENALRTYILEWGAQFGIDADFHCRDAKLDDLPEDVRTTIYRIVQEALTNIVKHAQGTTTVSVVLGRTNTTVQLTIEDNGSGFDATSTATLGHAYNKNGLGLVGMQERLSLIGGDMQIEASPGAGTTIFVRIPIEQEKMIA